MWYWWGTTCECSKSSMPVYKTLCNSILCLCSRLCSWKENFKIHNIVSVCFLYDCSIHGDLGTALAMWWCCRVSYWLGLPVLTFFIEFPKCLLLCCFLGKTGVIWACVPRLLPEEGWYKTLLAVPTHVEAVDFHSAYLLELINFPKEFVYISLVLNRNKKITKFLQHSHWNSLN